MNPVLRSSCGALAVLMLAACAAQPARPTPPATVGTPAGASTAVAIDIGLLREAARDPGVRPAFGACIEAAAGAAAASQACIDAELQYQQTRIDAALVARRGRSTSNGDVDAIQAQWRTERDRMCGSDAPGVPVALRVQAGVCKLEATAARADVLSR